MANDDDMPEPLELATGRAFSALVTALIRSKALHIDALQLAFTEEIDSGESRSDLELRMLYGIWDTICHHLDAPAD